MPAKTVVVGEVGLAGELRRVPHLPRRLHEAARLGYTRAIVPAGERISVKGMEVCLVSTLREAIHAANADA